MALFTSFLRARRSNQASVSFQQMESDMGRLMISALMLVALLIAGTELLRSRSLLINSHDVTTSVATSTSERRPQRGVDKLPEQDFEDLSLVFPREMKR